MGKRARVRTFRGDPGLHGGQEMMLRLPNYSQALKWARMERKSYNIPEPVADIESDDQVPLFLLPGSK